MAAHFVRCRWPQRCLLDACEVSSVPVSLLSKRRSEFRQIRARAIQRAPAVPQSKTSTELSGVRCSLATRSKTVYEHSGPQPGFLKGSEHSCAIATLANTIALMQATSILLLLAALMPAASLLAPTSPSRRFLAVSAKKKPAAAGGFGAAAPSTPKTKKKKKKKARRPRPTPSTRPRHSPVAAHAGKEGG